MFSPLIILIDLISASGESRVCKLKMKPTFPDNPESGAFKAEQKGIEYLPGKKMDVVAMYGTTHEEVFINVTSGKRRIIGVVSKLGSSFEATASVKADTTIRIWIEKQEPDNSPEPLNSK